MLGRMVRLVVLACVVIVLVTVPTDSLFTSSEPEPIQLVDDTISDQPDTHRVEEKGDYSVICSESGTIGLPDTRLDITVEFVSPNQKIPHFDRLIITGYLRKADQPGSSPLVSYTHAFFFNQKNPFSGKIEIGNLFPQPIEIDATVLPVGKYNIEVEVDGGGEKYYVFRDIPTEIVSPQWVKRN
jgi:hypothetical protein